MWCHSIACNNIQGVFRSCRIVTALHCKNKMVVLTTKWSPQSSEDQNIASSATTQAPSLTWPDPIPHWGTWQQSNLSPRNLIGNVNPVMMAIAKVRLLTLLHSQFRFLLCCSSWLETLLAQHTAINHILQVSCDWILCCDWYTLHGTGRQTALWPCPRPFPLVWNRVWPRETNKHQVFPFHVLCLCGSWRS